MLHCNCHGSIYDPYKGGAVVTGPTVRPLPAVALEWDQATDQLYAVRMVGPVIYGHPGFTTPTTDVIKFADLFHLRDVPLVGVPDYMFSIEYWLGGIATSALAWQVITELFLLFYYQPSNAYGSTMTIIHDVPFGLIILSSHLYGAYIIIFAVYMHGLYILIKGGYKRPRIFQLVLGVIMFALTLGVAFIGYSMTGDVLAVDVSRGILTALGVAGIDTCALR